MRSLRELNKDNKGIAGFFLDLPVFIVVVLVLTFFITTSSSMYFQFKEDTMESKMDKTCLELHRNVEMYEKFLFEGRRGWEYRHLSKDKLDLYSNKSDFDEMLEKQINVSEQFDYKIIINATEYSGIGYEFGAKKIPGEYRGDISSLTSPITLVNEDDSEKRYICKLTVIIWEAN